MQIDVLIFGAGAGAVGSDRVTVTTVDPPTVEGLSVALTEQYPALKFALASPRFAVNHTFASPETTIKPGDEVALITLVGGG